jgi:hypothetical protein
MPKFGIFYVVFVILVSKKGPCKIAATQQFLSIDWEEEKLQESVASEILVPEFVFSRMRYRLH